MNSSNLFVLGLLLLTANLSLGALFSPARAGRSGADRLVLLWKLLFLAAIQIGAWAVVLYQGDATLSLARAFSRAAACFALIGGSGGGLPGVWGEVAPFIALNGLLYIVVSILSLSRASTGPVDVEAEFTVPAALKHQREVLDEISPAPSRSGGDASADKTGGKAVGDPTPPSGAALHASSPKEPEFQRGGFRPTIPKAIPINVQLSPEEELAEQMKPVGPTPPPIRFEWKN